jgi:hypothetical protein
MRGRRGWYDVWFNFCSSFTKSPKTETESETLGLGHVGAFHKTVIKIEP